MGKIILTFFLVAKAMAYVWNPAYLGEKNLKYYFGPRGGDFKGEVYWGDYVSFGSGIFVEENEFYGNLKLKSDNDESDLFDHRIQSNLFTLFSDVDRLKQALICPQSEMTENYQYYRYLYRLISISYLFETLKHHDLIARKLDLQNTCKPNYKNVFEKCSPKTLDMRFFIRNVAVLLDNFEKELISFDHDMKGYQRTWFKDLENKNDSDLTLARMNLYCRDHECKNIKEKKNLSKFLNNVCKEDEQLLIKLCSEDDRLYGMSNTIYAYNIIQKTDALMAVNERGFAKGCLRRFSIQNSENEFVDPILTKIFPIAFSYLKENYDERFKQGQLYPLGSLKLFRDQGLNDFLSSQKVEKKEEVKTIAKAEIKKLPPLAPEPLKPFFKSKKVKKKKVIKKEVKKKNIVKSHFYQAAQVLDEYSLLSVEVEMEKFKYDYVFTPKMTRILESSLKKFSSFEGLKEMKEFDSLGTPKGAVPLRFIKFLIDTENHQGLFNMIEVLGDDFYVINDIDDKSLVQAPNRVKLQNDSSTNYQWQIYILAL